MRPATGFLLIPLLLSCGNPNINTLTPSAGPPRTLVEVNGDNFLSTAWWDANVAGEASMPGGFLGSYIFSVPPAAAAGAHNVQLRRSGNSGNVVSFNVTAPDPFGAPRLDRVGLIGTEFRPGNKIITWLWVQGANFDVGAEVLINNIVEPTIAMRGLRNDLFAVAPATLLFPIYHYLAIIASSGERDTGEILAVTVRNRDGLVSSAINYTLPTDSSNLDSDGDDLPDQWEVNGFDANGDGVIDVDLKALGAHPQRPDVFLEVDIMQSLTNTPVAATFQPMIDAFAAAPVINGFTANGINLVIDRSGTVPFSQTIDLTGADNAAAGFTNFYTLKAANFDNANRGRIYHYCIWANARPNGSSGISDIDFNNTGSGDDCIVSFDDFSAGFQTARSGAETLMHEFGHNLGQRHGGVTHFSGNPVYSSVMSYNWQLRSGQSNATRRARPVCVPFYYQQNVVENNGALPANAGTAVDYSEGMGQSLVEATLNENVGVCNNVAVDWNGNGNSTNNPVSVDINGNAVTTDTWTDFANWVALSFTGPRRNGSNGN